MKRVIVFLLLKITEFGGAYGLLYLTYRIFEPLTYGKAPTPFHSFAGMLFSLAILLASMGGISAVIVLLYLILKSNWNLAKRLIK